MKTVALRPGDFSSSECDGCGQQAISYNSCLNRHCPKCQGAARQLWLPQRSAELLPVPYYHVVFTLPHVLAPLALQNKALVYGLLFRAVAETLMQIAADPQHLGAEIGFLAILHTWGQTLQHHPHMPVDAAQPTQCHRSSVLFGLHDSRLGLPLSSHKGPNGPIRKRTE